ncbi:DapH/DapD/GlmU-related protein [Geobacter sp.]|uniref:acyltransferase n=1 Tax=Geobacter sp. TaxID=46610 RepID=UPI001AC3B9F5|nr:DapH/DapD/GlmU-related protein [Geobacter sp.]CAG1771599.1 Putative acetyltransferase [uncultured bacterium]
MKSTPFELATIASILLGITGVALLLTYLTALLTTSIFHEYHVLADAFLFIAFYLILSALTVRLLIRYSPLEAESHGIDCFTVTSKKAFFWKILTSVTAMSCYQFLPLIPLFLRPGYFALFGAKLGNNVEVAGILSELPLISVGDYAFIGGNTFITAHAVVQGMIILKPIKIGVNVTIGVGAIVMPGVEIGENSIVAPGSVVVMDTVIPPHEYWSGMPAQKERSLKIPRKGPR